MNCITHQGREAVGVCRECGNPICRECYDEFGGYCMHCAQKESKEIKTIASESSIKVKPSLEAFFTIYIL